MKGKYEELQASTNATQKSLKDQIGKLESSKAELEEKATAGKWFRTTFCFALKVEKILKGSLDLIQDFTFSENSNYG